MTAQLEWFACDGVRLPYVAQGDVRQRPMVVLPGLSDGLAPLSERRAREALPLRPRALAGRRLLIVSYRHPVEPGVTTADLAEDVAAFIRGTCDGAPVIVTGHSMGGMVAQHLAARHPGLVERLVLSATVPSADEQLRRIIGGWDELITAGRWRAFYRAAIDTSFTGSEALRRKVMLRLGSAPAMDHLLDRHVALSQACREHDARPVLGDIAAPLLLLAGEHDPIAPPRRAEELADAVGGARLEVLEGVSHGFPEQLRRRYVGLVRAFLDGDDDA